MRINKESLIKSLDKVNEEIELSGSIKVVEGHTTIFESSYGYANRNEKIPNRVNTRFGIASGCKGFTAVAICQLVDKGLIKFNTTLKECLDIEFPHFDSNITVEHLLTHTSGIPDYFDEEVMEDFEELWEMLPMYKIKESKDFLPLFQNNKMKFSPGNRFSYNNAGFILLGLIVEKISGVKFTEYIEKNVFEPCNMTDSGYFSMDNLPERTALGYVFDEVRGSYKTNIYSLPIVGGADGGAFTTAEDMIKFWDALLNYRLLSEEITKIMLTPHVREEENSNEFYGYGIWIIKDGDEIEKYVLMGSDPGVSFRTYADARKDIKAVALCNKDEGSFAIMKAIDANIE